MSKPVFLSYASQNRERLFDAFLEHLRCDYLALDGERFDEICFRDANDIRPGDTWPEEIQHEIEDCRVFVPLFSSSYFRSENCCREFQYSWERQGNGGQVVLPMTWEEVSVPAELDKLQRLQPHGYSSYRELLQLGRRAEVAREFRLLVREVLRAKNQFCAPKGASAPKWHELTAHFHRPVRNGPRALRFIALAARRSQLAASPTKLEAYGVEAEDWKPYYPSSPNTVRKIGDQAGERFSDFERHWVKPDQDLAEVLLQAQGENAVVILIADRRTFALAPGISSGCTLDPGRSALNEALMVPDDGAPQDESVENWAAAVERFFGGLARRSEPLFCGGVADEHALQNKIEMAIPAVYQQICRSGPVQHLIACPQVPQPKLTGPYQRGQ
jgi:hypothetical protein